MSAPLAFAAKDLHLELLDPGQFSLCRLYRQVRAGGPGGEWEPPPAAFRKLRVDPPPGHEHKFAVLYTADTLACIASECGVLQYNAAKRVFQVDRTLLAEYQVAHYTFAAPALFVRVDPDEAAALGLQPRSYTGGKIVVADDYPRYQAASLALWERYGNLAHGLSWQSMHRGQLGRAYGIWHHRKDDMKLALDPARPGAPLVSDTEWTAFETNNGGFADVPKAGTGP